MSENFDKRYSKRAFAKPKTFFWHFRPVGIMYLLVGIMPLKNLLHHDSKLLNFSVFSYPFLYSVILFLINVVGIVNFADPFLIFQKAQDFRSVNVWRYLVIVLVVTRSLISYYFCTSKSRKLVKLIQVLDLYDYKKTTAFKGTAWEALKRFVVWTLLPMASGMTIVSAMSMLFAQFAITTLENNKHSMRIPAFFGIIGALQMAPLLLYNYFAFVIYYNFNDIKKTAFRNIPLKRIHRNENIPTPPNFKITLQNLNQMYFLMSDAVKYLGKMFGWFLAVDQFYIIVMFVLNLYIYLFTENRDQNLLFCILTSALLNFVVINISHKVSEEANNIIEFMQKLPPLILEGEEKAEVQIVLSQILSSSVHVSAAGFFNINRHRLPSLLSSVATYLIVLVQFTKQGIYNDDFNRTGVNQYRGD